MSDGDYQRGGRKYLSFIFEDELVEPEQYLDWEAMRREYELELELKEYESIIKET